MSKVPKEEQSDEWQRLAARRDEDIDDSDIPKITDFSEAVRGRFYRPVKQQITLRIDADLVAWFRAHGDKYQRRINEALRAWVNEHGDRPT
ncbi:MAG: BrnA antitoxin family protein [Acidiferrobacteraceae bacterium]